MSTRTKVVLTKLVVFSPNDLVDDRLYVLIPMPCPAAVTNPEGDFGTTKDMSLSVHWRKLIPFIASSDWPRLQKSQRGTSPASDMVPTDRETPDGQRATSVSTQCVSYFTQPAQIRHAIVR